MKKRIFRFVCVIVVLALLLPLTFSVAASAESGKEYVQKSSFWQWAGSGIQKIIGYSFGAACPNSDDSYHHASSYYGLDIDQHFYRCICTYCGAHFTAYESDLQQSYNTQVEDIQDEYGTTEFGSKGFILPVPVIDIYGVFSQGNIVETKVGYSFSCAFVASKKYASSVYSDWCISVFPDFTLVAPVTGTYTLMLEGSFSNCEIHRSTPLPYVCHAAANAVLDDSSYYGIPGDRSRHCAFSVRNYNADGVTLSSFSGRLYFFVESATYNVNNYTANIGGITSRPTSITGNYGIIGDNGQITAVEDNSTIVNETNNTYYNPATGTTSPITDWSYNYADRSYTVTTETGDTVTVTYGDENITIKEGDTTYNVYYISPGSGSETPGPSPSPSPSPSPTPTPCAHDWQPGDTEPVLPTCTRDGSAVYTCSICGETKTEVLPAPGHSWQVKQSVSTQYDESGTLIQEGYTLYECTVCQEQYKDTEGAGPPQPPSQEKESIWEKIGKLLGSIFGGFVGLIEAALGKVLDALTALCEMLMEKLGVVVETILSVLDEVPKLFGGFLDFLSAVFPFLPPELMLLLTFGVIAIVVIGIIKALRR